MNALRPLGRAARSIPVAWSIAGVVLAASVLRFSLHPGRARGGVDALVSTGFDAVVVHHDWLSLVTAAFFVRDAVALAPVLAALVVGLGWAERRMGHLRVAVVFVTVSVLGVAFGLGAEALGLGLDVYSAEVTRWSRTIDPLVGLAGVLMAASAFAGPLVARRVRIVGFTALVVFVLYAGAPSDVYRLFAALLGFATGLVLTRGRRERPLVRRPRATRREARTLLAAVVAVIALGPLVTLAAPRGSGVLDPLGLLFRDPFGRGAVVGVLLTLVPLGLLLCAAWGIRRGRLGALWLAVGVNLALSALAAVHFGFVRGPGGRALPGGPDVAAVAPDYRAFELVSTLVPLAVAVLLAASFRLFPARAGGRRGGRLAGAFAGSGPVNERERVRALLTAGSGGTMSWMTTWPGNRYWFDAGSGAGGNGGGGGGAVAYRVIAGVAITTGDPLGPPVGHPATALAFAEHCADRGWAPAFYSVGEGLRAALAEAGWASLQVAEETVVHPEGWSTDGKKLQDVRSSINRAAKEGVRAEWATWATLGPAQARQIREISELWVAEKELPEMGFTLGGLDELIDPEVRLMLAIDAEGRVQGVTSWLPTWHEGRTVGWTLDFMRRAPDSMNGLMEFVIAQVILRARDEGLEFVSLSGAPLARSAPDAGSAVAASSAAATATAAPGATAPRGIDAVLAYLGRSLEPVYGFRSLLRFKLKFRPELQRLHLCYRDPLALPAIGLALGRAYLPTLSARQVLHALTARG